MKEDVISRKGGWRAGSWRWQYYSGDSASISYESNTNDPHDMWLRLHYTHIPYFDDPQKMDYKIRIVTTRPHYGGKRFWFECPLTHRRAAVLYSTGGCKWFASRYAYSRCKYRSQGMGAADRANSRLHKLTDRLEDDGKYFMKPKGMHWKTFNRRVDEIDRAEEICDYHLVMGMNGLFLKYGAAPPSDTGSNPDNA